MLAGLWLVVMGGGTYLAELHAALDYALEGGDGEQGEVFVYAGDDGGELAGEHGEEDLRMSA